MKNLNDNNTLTIVIVLYKEPFELIYKTLNLIKDFKIIIIDNDNNNELKNKILNHLLVFRGGVFHRAFLVKNVGKSFEIVGRDMLLNLSTYSD